MMTKLRSISVGYPGSVAIVAAIAWIQPVSTAHAADVAFTAELDRNEISQDESVALKMSVRADGQLQLQGPPRFSAPDFDLVNEFTSNFVESFYENGKFGIRNNQQFTKVLRPKRTGTFKIERFEIQVNGNTVTAPPLTVRVAAGGAGTPPPQNYGGGGMGLRGAVKKPSQGSTTGFFVRAEIDKARIYKGEQLVVSYFLYRRARVFNIQVDKYPILGGFLREDLEMPVLGQRLDNENVVLDGVPYERSLLSRYAAYPLKEGKLPIDSMTIKANYFNPSQFGMSDEDDPFMGFFNQLAPRSGTSTSDPVSVEVLPLPTDGRPASFAGGIGDFQLSSSADKGEVKANEAVTLTLSVQGKGNISAIEAPKVPWPTGIELYESKGKVKGGKAGIGQKDFEFLLVPRASGRITLPAIEMSFFDPEKKTFVTRSTQPIEIQVAEGLPPVGSLGVPSASSNGNRPSGTAGGPRSDLADTLAPLKRGADTLAEPILRWSSRVLQVLVALGWLAMTAVAAMIGHRVWLRRQKRAAAEASIRRAAETKSWSRLGQLAKTLAVAAPGPDTSRELILVHELLCGAVYDAIDREYALGARSLPRAELGRLLTEEQGLPSLIWERLAKLLEYSEMVRYASQAGMVSDQAARGELVTWVSEGQSLAEALARRKTRPSALE